jgi:hypothetical protein
MAVRKKTVICPYCGSPAEKMQERNTIVEFFHAGGTVRHIANKSDLPEYNRKQNTSEGKEPT